MLNRQELSFVYEHAYLPEHLPAYVEAVTGAEPFLHLGRLCFCRGDHLIFIGYPLGQAEVDTPAAYRSACERFQPTTAAIIASEIWLPDQPGQGRAEDAYYRLALPLGPPAPAVAYMVRRAAREVRVGRGVFGREHRRLVDAFIASHELSREQKLIFSRIPRYLKRSAGARLLEARKGRALVAFSVMDTGAADYAFYLFNFRSMKTSVPGAGDLLFHRMVELAQAERKRAVNLGLGVNPGVRHFKEKWGGVPYWPYASAFVERRSPDLGALLKKL